MKLPTLHKNTLGCLAFCAAVSTATLPASASAADVVVNPKITAYYANYDTYFNNACNPSANSAAKGNDAGHAIASPGYLISGAAAGSRPMSPNCVQLDEDLNSLGNADLLDKIRAMDGLSYAFLTVAADKLDDQHTPQPIPGTGGGLSFSDPWADLSQGDADFCKANTTICGQDPKWYDPAIDWTQYLHYGNFSAAVALMKKAGKEITISVGGWETQSDYYTVFSDPKNIQNFVNTLKAIKEKYGITRVDFDIEDHFPGDSTHANFQRFFSGGVFNNLVTAIKSAPDLSGLNVELTIQANPDNITKYIGPALKANAKSLINNLQYVNLMTYDFAGAFSAKTSYNSNLYDKDGYSAFSVDAAVQALIDQAEVPSTKIKIGIPAYERAAIGNIPDINGGLGQEIKPGQPLLPGNLDRIGTFADQGPDNNKYYCYAKTGLPSSALEPCSGTFTYRYVMDVMLKNGFTATEHPDAVATTAYAKSFNVQQFPSFNYAKVQGVQKDYPHLPATGVFISYLSAKDACQYGAYAAEQKLAGGILWEVMGDLPPSDSRSLMNAFNWGYAKGDCGGIVALQPMQPVPEILPLNLMIKNNSDAQGPGINFVLISDSTGETLFKSGYIDANNSATYGPNGSSQVSISQITGKNNLTVSYQNTNQSLHYCDGSFSFNKNTTLSLNELLFKCTFSQP